eukprot:Blabericola_migrator_1__8029@NODE_411_length_8732_cov_37_171725_g324_i0_p12_GENE_NODE_411_length_8732_cov_37_171725_g324_i0NODE_411_length_8732_cov_37_171725_g324_i0_p12_ORF_typecomplete_len100_score17_73_NODE_411_length_8732_cov_37_171725_g324_i017642063
MLVTYRSNWSLPLRAVVASATRPRAHVSARFESAAATKEKTDQYAPGVVRSDLAVAYPEIPLGYYRSSPAAEHSITHRMFYPNWLAVAAALEIIRECWD